ncbi:DEAD/DEAH box helicase [uncultured Pseudodesulfovibrio sp.]|uniref:DEAD/DEAH box helicase n=1 Tax=uncultured Pseudodesulfovibrio sp. TaxID=2035858 RepID=UPI0029C9587B|nr:DEAD/DEAH box helicase [uncultured Pseudodesulfovibrio sp.]
MRFGFPLYSEEREKAYPVWVRLRDKVQEGPTITWNGERLRDDKPILRNASFNEILSHITTAFDVAFTTELDLKPDNGRVEIAGQSAGLCMEACKIFKTNASDTDILFTGQVHNGCLRALGPKGHVEEKMMCAIDHSAILVVPFEDAEYINKRHIKADREEGEQSQYLLVPLDCVATDQDKVSNNSRRLKEDFEKQQNHILIAIHGDNWKCAIGEGLNLTQRVPLKGTQDENLVAFSDKTFSDLFSCALPSLAQHKPSDFKKYITTNTYDNNHLFKNGILDIAVRADKGFFAKGTTGYFPKGNLLIGGATGCGKTLLAYALLLNAVSEYDGNAIYVAPTKELVYEAAEAFRNILPQYPKSASKPMINSATEVFVSTGEYAENDWRIANGSFKVAFIVYEKANLFIKSEQLINNLAFVAIDELHMFSDDSRGGVLDTFVTKVLDQAEKRKGDPNFTNSNSLRVLGITTEAVEDDINLEAYFQGKSGEKCKTVMAHNRPIPVAHYIQPNFCDMEYPPTEINTFTGTLSRNVAPLLLSQLKQDISDATKSGRRTSVSKYIVSHSTGHRKVIVAGTAIPILLGEGKKIAKKRSNYSRLSAADEASLSEALNKSNLPTSFAKQLLQRARKGVFFHYSSLDPHVRKLMADLFRQKSKSDLPYPDILFATETITYGLNLPADCLILTGIIFSRQNTITGQHIDKPLSKQQFHNLTGRVGRYGKTKNTKGCKVVIIARNSNEARTVLNEYAGLSTCHSGGVSAGELKLVSEYLEDIEKETDHSFQTPIHLQQISYSFFRMVLDALRYKQQERGDSVNEATILQLLKQTFTWRYHKRKSKELEMLTHMVLEQTVRLEKDLKIPEIIVCQKNPISQEEQFSLTSEGEALIDTGSKWQSIVPMRFWLDKISSTKDENLPVELLVPAFVACKELWHTYRNFFEEFEYENASSVHKGLEVANTLLKNEFRKLPNMEGKVDALCNHVGDLFYSYRSELKLSTKYEAVNRHSQAVFIRMIVALLRWVRGEELEEINRLRYASSDDPPEEDLIKNYGDKYGQKAAWLADMCLRFFFSNTLLSEKHARDLTSLAMRLRYGLPLKGLAFFKGSPMGFRLSRKEVISLLKHGATPETIILSDNPAGMAEKFSKDAADEINTSELTVPPEKIVTNIFKYYCNSLENLCGAFSRGASYRNDWEYMPKAIRNIFDTCEDINSEKSDWDKAIEEFIANYIKATQFGELKITTQSDDHTLRLSRGEGTEIILRFKTPYTEEDASGMRNNIVVRLPWKGNNVEQRGDIEMNIFGILSLTILLRGGSLSMKATKSWLLDAKEKGKRTCSHHDLLAIKSVKSKVPSEVLEAMLAIAEPEG